MRTLDRGGVGDAENEVVCLPKRDDVVRGADLVDVDFDEADVGVKKAGDALEEVAVAVDAVDVAEPPADEEACRGSYRHKMDSG